MALEVVQQSDLQAVEEQLELRVLLAVALVASPDSLVHEEESLCPDHPLVEGL